MTTTTFNVCLDAYQHHCETTDWVKDESYKFFFANGLFKSVNLGLQDDATVLNLCKKSLKEDYSLGKELSLIGVQFLQKAGYDQISVAITLEDIQIIKYLWKNDIPDKDFFESRGMSYTGLAGWLSTLIPKKFMPVVVTYFSKTIPYLFGLGDDFPKSGYKYFIQGQEYFKRTKNILIQRHVPQYFLERINAYRTQAELGEQKKRYHDLDWNWIVQDFHLFVYKVYLDLWAPKTKATKKENDTLSPILLSSILAEPRHIPGPAAITFESYTPPPLNLSSVGAYNRNRDLTFSANHYLEKYKNQLTKGTRCEQLILKKEKERLSASGRNDLADQVEIVSDNPDNGFDIKSFEVDETPMQIEVKAIPSNTHKSFYITANELEKSAILANYYIYCVYESGDEEPQIFRLKRPNLHDPKYFIKEPLVYRVSFM